MSNLPKPIISIENLKKLQFASVSQGSYFMENFHAPNLHSIYFLFVLHLWRADKSSTSVVFFRNGISLGWLPLFVMQKKLANLFVRMFVCVYVFHQWIHSSNEPSIMWTIPCNALDNKSNFECHHHHHYYDHSYRFDEEKRQIERK
jgi:hypothetical protein